MNLSISGGTGLNANLYAGMTSYRFNTGSSLDTNNYVNGNGIFPNSPPVQILAITDGTSNTIMFGEYYNYDPNSASLMSSGLLSNFPNAIFNPFSTWASVSLNSPRGNGGFPLNGMISTLSKANYRNFAYGSGHTQGANFVFCDGSVHFISNGINNAPTLPNGNTLLGALCTRAGGEVVDASQY